MEQDEITTLRRDLKNHLQDNEGETVYWGETIVHRAPYTVHSAMSDNSSNGAQYTVNGERLSKIQQLETFRTQSIGDCHLCPLGDTRIKLVFGVGNPEAEVMFVGEGPGYAEDRQGEPFVGKAGQLLDKIMAAIGLDRSKVYIANIVKCHPMVDSSQPDKRGNDRPPAPEEIEKCRPFLMEQIRIIRPKFIVTLGGTATKALLGISQGITAARGKLFDLQVADEMPPIRVLPTFHPAALLRDESLKKAVWEDMKLRDILN